MTLFGTKPIWEVGKVATGVVDITGSNKNFYEINEDNPIFPATLADAVRKEITVAEIRQNGHKIEAIINKGELAQGYRIIDPEFEQNGLRFPILQSYKKIEPVLGYSGDM